MQSLGSWQKNCTSSSSRTGGLLWSKVCPLQVILITAGKKSSKTYFHPSCTPPPPSHTHSFAFFSGSHPYRFILSHLLFTCSPPPRHPVFPLLLPSLCQCATSSKCKARHQLATCSGHFFFFYWHEKVQSSFPFNNTAS